MKRKKHTLIIGIHNKLICILCKASHNLQILKKEKNTVIIIRIIHIINNNDTHNHDNDNRNTKICRKRILTNECAEIFTNIYIYPTIPTDRYLLTVQDTY